MGSQELVVKADVMAYPEGGPRAAGQGDKQVSQVFSLLFPPLAAVYNDRGKADLFEL